MAAFHLGVAAVGSVTAQADPLAWFTTTLQ